MARPRRSASPPSRTPAFKRAKKFQPKPARAPWMGRLLRYLLALVSAAIMANALFGARGLMTTIRARQDYAALETRVERMRADNARMR
jgi:cell division protein FtsB